MKKHLLIIALLMSNLMLNAQSVGDESIIDYGNYSLKFTVTSVNPNECEVYKDDIQSYVTSITIPSSAVIGGNEYTVTSIGEYGFAFLYDVTTILFESDSQLVTIGERAFNQSDELINFEIPNSVAHIGGNAFCQCPITNIEIPNSVISMGINPFEGCTSLETITVEDGNQYYDSRNDCNAIIETATNTLITGCKNTIIPNTVTSIGSCSFMGNSLYYDTNHLTSIEIPNSVTTIGDSAFSYCTALTNIEIPNSVTTIGDNAFNHCTALTDVIFEENSQLDTIGEWAFEYCESINSIEIPNSVVCIKKGAFNRCQGITSLIVQDGNTVYDSRNYCNAIIETATNKLVVGCQNTIIPNTITSIEEYAFGGCDNLIYVDIPSSVNRIGMYAFAACNNLLSIRFYATSVPDFLGQPFDPYFSTDDLQIQVPEESIELYKGDFYLRDCVITKIHPYHYGEYLTVNEYEGYSLKFILNPMSDACDVECETEPTEPTSITIPSSVSINGNVYDVTTIKRSAFSGCMNLTNIEIPNSVTSIGSYAFSSCRGLVEFNLPSSVVSIGADAFNDCSNLTNFIIAENSQLESIPYGAFSDCTSLTNIDLPNSLTSIGKFAFSDCTNLADIDLPNSLTYIGLGAFDNCDNLVSIVIPSSVTTIQVSSESSYPSFSSCDKLTNIVVESGNPAYDSRDNCNAIIETATNKLIFGCKNTVIPNTVTSIGYSAFSDCDALTSIELPNSVTSIEKYAFRGCNNLANIVLPNSISSIGGYAFRACNNLVIRCYAEDVPEAEATAFQSCDNLVIQVPEQSLELYQSTAPWNEHEIVAGFYYTINANVNNPNYGIVEGTGNYDIGAEVTLKAIANSGRLFLEWIEDNEVISTDKEYTFIANADRELTANFVNFNAPTNLTATVQSTSSVMLSWNHATYALGYNIYEGDELIAYTEDNSYMVEDLNYYTDYCFTVTSVHNGTETEHSYEACATTFDLPITTPLNCVATAESTSSISLTWNAVENALSYNIYEGDNLIGNVSSNSYTVNDLGPYTEHCYSVTAVRNVTETTKSDEACARTIDLSISTPTNLVAAAEGISSISLNWNTVENALSYNVYNGDELYMNINENSCIVEGLNHYTEYCFTVTAVRNITETEASEEACASTLDLPITAPVNVTAIAMSTSSISLSWSIVENAMSYNVYKNGTLLTNINEPICIVEGLEYDTEYCFTVTALRNETETEHSEEVCIKTLGESIEEFTSSFEIYPNPVDVNLHIDAVTNIEKVIVYDVNGQEIMVERVASEQMVISTVNLKPGIYFVRIETAETVITKKIVKD